MKALEEIINGLDREALSDLTEHLLGFVNAARVERIDQILALRTRHLTVVLENVYRPYNASAVVRTCECFGIQDLHVIESRNRFQVNNAIVQGSAKWLTLYRHGGSEGTKKCLRQLRDAGYRIVAMDPDSDNVAIGELDVHSPLALCFGSEDPGLSPEALELSDLRAGIPMHGFTQSLNLSVSVGISIERLTTELHQTNCEWRLEPNERLALRCLWLAQSISAGISIVHRHLNGSHDE